LGGSSRWGGDKHSRDGTSEFHFQKNVGLRVHAERFSGRHRILDIWSNDWYTNMKACQRVQSLADESAKTRWGDKICQYFQ
jgi:hypothetical protein